MKAIALVADSVLKSRLKDYFIHECERRGVDLQFHSVSSDCKSYTKLFNAHDNIVTWNCRMPHSWLTSKGKNVLFIENSLICQSAGIFVDSRGFFSNSNLRHDRSWMNEPQGDHKIDQFVRRHFSWEPFSGGSPDGPLLVCLQNGPDSNLQQEFPLGKEKKDKVRATLELLAEHLPPNQEVIIRPHPRALAEWNKNEHQYRAECWNDAWQVSSEGKLSEVLPKCKAMVAVNSTAVSEAITLGMPVATLGTGVFSESHVTLECSSDPSLLRSLCEFRPQLDLCRRYVSRILGRHFLPYNGAITRPNEELDSWLGRCTQGRESSAPPRQTVETPKHLGGHLSITHVDAGSLAWLQYSLSVQSMVDIGCGPGGMRRIARGLGISWTGVDGDPACAGDDIITHDYTKGPLHLDPVDLAWSVEFLEHVHERHLANVLSTFRNATHICVTHALPGKKGWHHVNCQPPEYWIDQFSKAGYVFDKNLTDAIRHRSTMKRNFVRDNGLFFTRQPDTPAQGSKTEG